MTGSTHSRQVAGALSQIEKVTSTQGLENAGFLTHERGAQKTNSGCLRKERRGLPMLTGRQIAYQICAFLKFNEVEERSNVLSSFVG